jgi:hypothetical protein
MKHAYGTSVGKLEWKTQSGRLRGRWNFIIKFVIKVTEFDGMM